MYFPPGKNCKLNKSALNNKCVIQHWGHKIKGSKIVLTQSQNIFCNSEIIFRIPAIFLVCMS